MSEEDLFFDACEEDDPSCSENCSTSTSACDWWMNNELSSVQERRNKFLKETGLDEFFPELCKRPPIRVCDSSDSNVLEADPPCCVLQNLDDDEERPEEQEAGQQGSVSLRKQAESDNPMKLGLFHPIKKLLRKDRYLCRRSAARKKAGSNFLQWTRRRSSVCKGQEFRGHKGLIRVMKFSRCGSYLATGGEDGVLRVWQIGDENDEFRIVERPLHEFFGHRGEILDLAWSNSGSNFLLSSSKDKTVRLWRVGSTNCQGEFQHCDFVTCVQFSPNGDSQFISGSVDGKVRIWNVTTSRVVDWVDTHDSITAISYYPDGKGFVVGSIAGRCWIYSCAGENAQLQKILHKESRKKSSCNRITGLLHFSSKEAHHRLMIASAKSGTRTVDPDGAVRKLAGPKKSKFSGLSCSSDTAYMASIGSNSRIHLWSLANSSAGRAAACLCESFSSPGATAATIRLGALHPSVLRSSSDTGGLRTVPRCVPAMFWSDRHFRSPATWPEEGFSPSRSMVIVTASDCGMLRTYSYSLPFRI